jgi:hypothetical protein
MVGRGTQDGFGDNKIVSSRERKETVAAIRQLMRLRGSIVTDVRSGQAEGEP